MQICPHCQTTSHPASWCQTSCAASTTVSSNQHSRTTMAAGAGGSKPLMQSYHGTGSGSTGSAENAWIRMQVAVATHQCSTCNAYYCQVDSLCKLPGTWRCACGVTLRVLSCRRTTHQQRSALCALALMETEPVAAAAPLSHTLPCRFHPSAVRWCLTVPAGLSQTSMYLMRRAAMTAGLIPSADSPSLIITSEPEAAALTAQQQKDLPGQQLVAGMSMSMLCISTAHKCHVCAWL
jgi:hypothetical protein